MNITSTSVIRTLRKNASILMVHMAKMEEAGEEWYFIKTSKLNTRIAPKLGLFFAIYLGFYCIFLLGYILLC
jgi:hypothetical protein